jgi:hypothetical protein
MNPAIKRVPVRSRGRFALRSERGRKSTNNLAVQFPIPDEASWPDEFRAWFRRAGGTCGPREVVFFCEGSHFFAGMESAIAVLTFVDILPLEWIGRMYPFFRCHIAKLETYTRELAAAGFTVRICEPAGVLPAEHQDAQFSADDLTFLSELGVTCSAEPETRRNSGPGVVIPFRRPM